MPLSVWLLAAAAACFFGTGLVFTVFGLRWLEIWLGAVVSVLTSTAMFFCLAPFYVDTDNWVNSSVLIFATVGLFFPALVTLLAFESNRQIGPNVTGSLGNLAPLFAVAFAVSALGEEPTLLQVASLTAIVIGVSLLSFQRRKTLQPWSLWVFLLPITAAFMRGATQPAIKLGLEAWPNPLVAALVGYAISSLVLIAIAVFRTRGWPQGLNSRGIVLFAGVGVCHGLAVLTMYGVFALGPITLASPTVATYPLVTLVLNSIYLKNVRLTRSLIFGVITMVMGVASLLVG
ncbi:MAG: hypothetical protein CFH03_01780 [Alphaproteobacteria bacterium MarineAlpha3_Bin2]|nr:MAG: hypothetical protein CFH03_01780 [Alphaproteobacteria bacterium MarineAlpha3_Bin2]